MLYVDAKFVHYILFVAKSCHVCGARLRFHFSADNGSGLKVLAWQLCEIQDGGDGGGDLWWLDGNFFVIIVLYIMSFIRIAGHCNACQWSYF